MGRNAILRSSIVEQDWRKQAACFGQTHLFYSTGYSSQREIHIRERKAKAICAGCPVLAECREYALSVDDDFAILAGMTPDERLRVKSRQRRRKA